MQYVMWHVYFVSLMSLTSNSWKAIPKIWKKMELVESVTKAKNLLSWHEFSKYTRN